MQASSIWRAALFLVVAASFVPTASAQNVFLDAPGLLPKKKAPAPPPPTAPPTAWPRLDPGAVFCQTEDDLARHASNMVAQVGGGTTEAADCRIIGNPVAIQILNREGLGRTQVKLAGPAGETGWTDAWLPAKPPPAR
jgi:hypothetical protein